MDKPAAQPNQFANRDFNGLFAQILLRYLETSAPEGSVERVLQLAGETRSVTELVDASKWSTYTQFRRLLEAAGGVLGGPDGLFQVGKHIYDSIHSPELSESLSVFPTPADVYAALPAIIRVDCPGLRVAHGEHWAEPMPNEYPVQAWVRAVSRELRLRCGRAGRHAQTQRVRRCRGCQRDLPVQRRSLLPVAGALGGDRQ